MDVKEHIGADRHANKGGKDRQAVRQTGRYMDK